MPCLLKTFRDSLDVCCTSNSTSSSDTWSTASDFLTRGNRMARKIPSKGFSDRSNLYSWNFFSGHSRWFEPDRGRDYGHHWLVQLLPSSKSDSIQGIRMKLLIFAITLTGILADYVQKNGLMSSSITVFQSESVMRKYQLLVLCWSFRAWVMWDWMPTSLSSRSGAQRFILAIIRRSLMKMKRFFTSLIEITIVFNVFLYKDFSKTFINLYVLSLMHVLRLRYPFTKQ